MERAEWNGRVLHAFDVADDADEEEIVRKASREGKITCPDPQCRHPVLKYCHGTIRIPYFAHRTKGGCDYSAYDETNTEELILIRRAVANALAGNGIEVKEEQKLLDHHYADLSMVRDGKFFAAELVRLAPRADTIRRLIGQYMEKGITVSWIMPEKTMNEMTQDRMTTARYEKYFLYGSITTITVLEDRKSVRQEKRDPDVYTYNGKELHSSNYPDVYRETADIRYLTLDRSGKITIDGFYARYAKWHANKQSAFSKQIQLLKKRDEEERKRREEEEKRRKALEEERERIRQEEWQKQFLLEQEKQRRDEEERKERQKEEEEENKKSEEVKREQERKFNAYSRTPSWTAAGDTGAPGIIEAYNGEMLNKYIEQQEKPVWYRGHRVAKCEICGEIKDVSRFAYYGGRGKMNLGLCRDCQKKLREEGKD